MLLLTFDLVTKSRIKVLRFEHSKRPINGSSGRIKFMEYEIAILGTIEAIKVLSFVELAIPRIPKYHSFKYESLFLEL